MPQIVSDFFFFTYAVLSYWQAYATGGLVTAIVGLFERFTERRLTKKAYLGLFVVTFLFAAFFFAWRAEHTQSTALVKKTAEIEDALQQETRKHTPDIRLSVEDAFAGVVVEDSVDSPNDTGLIFYMAARNVGLMPSIVDGYLLTLKIPNVGTVLAENVPLTKGFTLRSTSGEAVRMERSNALYEKTLQPIPSGGMQKGILVFVVRNVRESQLYSGATYELTWRDVIGNTRRLNGRMAEVPKSTRIPFVPGIEQVPLPSASPEK